MAKRAAFSGDRKDPKNNKTLAIRKVLQAMPKSSGAEIVAEVKKQFGHNISVNRVYMVKTKLNKKPRSAKAAPAAAAAGPSKLSSADQWVEAIRIAKKLLEATGSVADATALLKAVEQ
jgi:hypothetical protein